MTTMTFAYLILAHKNPKQLERLVRNLLADNVFVFVHIDEKTNETPFVELLTAFKNVFFCKRSSDEMFFQTMLLNSHFKETVVNTNLRKIDWSVPETQPRIWLYGDIELLKTIN